MHEKTYITPSDLRALAKIDQWVQDGKKVTRLVEDDGKYGGRIITGTPRYFCDGEADNIATQNLRVTTLTGFEVFWPVSELVEEVKSGHFTNYDWS